MPPRKERPAERVAPRRPDRRKLVRVAATLLAEGPQTFPTSTWHELFGLVNIPEAHAPMLVYGFRLRHDTLASTDPRVLADLLLAEFDERAAGIS